MASVSAAVEARGVGSWVREAGVGARACPVSLVRSLMDRGASPFATGVVGAGELPVGLFFFGTWAEPSVVSASASGRLRWGCEVGPIEVDVDSCRRRGFQTTSR